MNSRRLIVQTENGSRELLFIGRLTVGRATECDISLNDGKVSRRHAELDATGPVPRITDLGSRNGLLVNNRKVASAELQPGDVIVIGDAKILVEAADETIAAPGFDGLATSGHEDRTAIIDLSVPPPTSAPPPSAPVPAPPPLPSQTPSPVAAAPPPPPSAPAEAAPPNLAPPEVQVPAAPPPQAPPAPPVERPGVPADDERTAVLARPVSPSQVMPVLPSAADDERTAVIPRDAIPRRVDPPPAAVSPPVAAPPPPAFVPPSSGAVASAPPPPAPLSGAAPIHAGLEMPLQPSAPPVAAGGAVAAPVALAAPRFSWGGMLMLLCIGLGALATLMAAVPLLSSSSQAIDALSTRQARTIVHWLADGAGRDTAPTTADAIVQTVLSQDNVTDAMVLDAVSGQVVAPIRGAGRTLATVPGAGAEWRSLRGIRVVVAGEVIDALLPFSRGGVPHLAWVRYEKPSTSGQSLALVVALFATMVLAFVASLLIRRHTAAMLGLFTRQVELAVSGADTRVMQGTLVPGLDRLPGIIAYLLEQRKAGATASAVGPARVRDDMAPAASVEEAAWIIVTPSLSVTETSPHAPSVGIRNWASGARGAHLLDVLEAGALCNAVVQGLGALSNAPGADMTVPVAGRAPVSLRREAGGHVRISLPMR